MDKLHLGIFNRSNNRQESSSSNIGTGITTNNSSTTRKSFQVNKVKQNTDSSSYHNSGYLNSNTNTNLNMNDDYSSKNNIGTPMYLSPPTPLGLGIGSNKIQNPRLSRLLNSPSILTDPGIVGETKRTEILEKQLREVSIHASTAFDQVDELSTNNEMLLEQVDEQKNMIMQLLYQLKLLENEKESANDKRLTSEADDKAHRNSTSSEVSSKMSLSNGSMISEATTIDQINEQKEEISKQLKSSISQNEKLMNNLEYLNIENTRLSKLQTEKDYKIQELEYQLLDSKSNLINHTESELTLIRKNITTMNRNQNTLSMINLQIKEMDDEFENDIMPIRKLMLCEKYDKSHTKMDYSNKDETFVINKLIL